MRTSKTNILLMFRMLDPPSGNNKPDGVRILNRLSNYPLASLKLLCKNIRRVFIFPKHKRFRKRN